MLLFNGIGKLCCPGENRLVGLLIVPPYTIEMRRHRASIKKGRGLMSQPMGKVPVWIATSAIHSIGSHASGLSQARISVDLD